MILVALLMLGWLLLAVCMVIIMWEIHFLLGIAWAALIIYALYKDLTR